MDPVSTDGSDRFRALYDANRERVHRLLRRIVGSQDAEDLTQIVFAKAAKAFRQFRGQAEISTWLHRIAVNVASDCLRSRAAREAKLTVPMPDGENGERPGGGAELDHPSSPERQLARKNMRDCIRAEIAKLSASSRDVLILGELGGLADTEVAQTLGISPANAKVRLHRARAQLKKAIAARCEFYRVELSCAPNEPTCCPPAALPDTVASDR